jgi:hypothetical protein
LTAGSNPEGEQWSPKSRLGLTLNCLRSMPYAQIHYPFGSKELFENTFPVNDTSDGIDQNTGLVLHPTSTVYASVWQSSRQNLIVTGLDAAQFLLYGSSVSVIPLVHHV